MLELRYALVDFNGTLARDGRLIDVVCTDVRDAIDLLLTPMRLVATLRG